MACLDEEYQYLEQQASIYARENWGIELTSAVDSDRPLENLSPDTENQGSTPQATASVESCPTNQRETDTAGTKDRPIKKLKRWGGWRSPS